MLELIDAQPLVGVDEAEYRRLLGYPARHVLEGRARELADWAREWYAKHGRPWVYARQTDGVEVTADALRIDGAAIISKRLHEQWVDARTSAAMLVAVSAGTECEEKSRELWQEGKPDEYFFLESYGSAVVEHLITATGGRICAWAEPQGMAALPHYSPGYTGWDISDQVRLYELIRQPVDRSLPGELRLLDSGMLQPKKSMLALFGVTRSVERVTRYSALTPCETCALAGCQYRRAPYRRALPQLEDVRRLQGQGTAANGAEHAGLRPDARYTVHPRALKKWTQERLRLEFLEDGSVEARFRYDGTTCSNMGRPLQFDYYVKLGSASESFPILQTGCAPATDDTGHTVMCEYLKDGELLMRKISSECPLAGRPLAEVLDWERDASPAGCYCEASSRAHKWGLVLEVLHYALVQRAEREKPVV